MLFYFLYYEKLIRSSVEFISQIREDVKSGVYVENLTEECVSTMADVIRILMKVFTSFSC